MECAVRNRNAFTLVEVLIVIGIILVLISILFPVVNAARDQAKATLCQTHLRALSQGLIAFAADHDHRMPGSANATDCSGPDATKWDWLEGKYATGGGVTTVNYAPQSGTLFPYVNHDYNVYLCPALDLAVTGANGGPGGGSNGRFDYTAFEFFSGAHIDRLPQQAKLTDSAGVVTMLPCPTITEEDANEVNSGNKDPNHSNVDHMGHQHRGGGYYVATDFSVQYFIENPVTGYASEYTALSSRGKWAGIGSGAQPWGWWEQQ